MNRSGTFFITATNNVIFKSLKLMLTGEVDDTHLNTYLQYVCNTYCGLLAEKHKFGADRIKKRQK